jgi:hypothetical protein
MLGTVRIALTILALSLTLLSASRKRQNFRKKLLEHKMCFIFLNFLETFFIPINIWRVTLETREERHVSFYVRRPLFVTHLNKNSSMSKNSVKLLKTKLHGIPFSGYGVVILFVVNLKTLDDSTRIEKHLVGIGCGLILRQYSDVCLEGLLKHHEKPDSRILTSWNCMGEWRYRSTHS